MALVDKKVNLVGEYPIYQIPVIEFMRIIVPVMILILMASALSGCIEPGDFVQGT